MPTHVVATIATRNDFRGIGRRIRCVLFLFSLFLVATTTRAQVAGLSSLSPLDLPSDARASALGLEWLAVASSDNLQRLDNPSLFYDNRRDVSLTIAPLFDRSTFGAIAYSFDSPHLGYWVVGLRFVNYGSFDGYDENDQPTGTFHAGDYMLVGGWGLPIDSNFSVGVALKPVYSQYESYKAFGIAVDMGATYMSDNRHFVASVMARNIGRQFLAYDGSSHRLPFELAAHCSYKLQKAPFRFFAALNELQRWNLRYEDPLNPSSTTDPFTGEVSSDSDAKVFFDRLARHVAVGIELDLKGKFFLRVGYNYRQTRETQYVGNSNGSGFSFGAAITGKRLDVSYGRNNYHLSQAVNYFSLNFHL